MNRVLLIFGLLVACSGGEGTDPDAMTGSDAADSGTRDAGLDADASLDAGADAALDAGGEDASADSDAGEDVGSDSSEAGADATSDAGEDGSSDAAGDTGSDAAGDTGPDADTCEYLDLDVFIVDCAGGYQYARRLTDLGGDPRVCPDYFTLGTMRFDSLEDALASDLCDPECLRGPSMSVTLLRCGRRTGYIVYRDREPDCEDAYETPDGIFPSVEAWNEAAPCGD